MSHNVYTNNSFRVVGELVRNIICRSADKRREEAMQAYINACRRGCTQDKHHTKLALTEATNRVLKIERRLGWLVK
jgi:hypothetical protein